MYLTSAFYTPDVTHTAATRTVHCLYTQNSVRMCAFLMTLLNTYAVHCVVFLLHLIYLLLLLIAMVVCSFMCVVFWFLGSQLPHKRQQANSLSHMPL